MRNRLVTLVVMCLVPLPASGAEPAGSLVIVGGGAMPTDVRAEFVRLAGGAQKARIVVIPTASTYADSEKELDGFLKPWRELKPADLQILHTRDRKKADDPAFVRPLQQATGVWISGGDQTRLTAAYRDTRVHFELHELLQRDGVIGGTSAGAAVMSDPMIEGGNPVAKTGPGFGFLPNIVVDQHFVARKRIDRLRGVLKENPKFAGLGIDEGTAAIIRGHSLIVLGESTVTAIFASSSDDKLVEKILKSGDRLDLSTLRLVIKPK